MTQPKRTTEEAIENLSTAQKMQLIEQAEQFERDGVIGECELRTMAKALPGCGPHEVMFMVLLANECYRYFANKWFTELNYRNAMAPAEEK
jgi:hypothetical protein